MKGILSGLLTEKSLRLQTHFIGYSLEALIFGRKCRREKLIGFKVMDIALGAPQVIGVFTLQTL